MPELPEVETIRRQLADRVAGRTIVEAQMPLKREPFEPRATPRYLFGQYVGVRQVWDKFLPLAED